MDDHLACIGIRATDAESFAAAVDPLLAAGTNEQGPGASAAVIWSDESGAGLVASVGPSGDPECVRPAFFGDGRAHATGNRIGSHATISYCDPFVVDLTDGSDGDPIALAVHVDDMALTRPLLPEAGPVVLRLALFAEAVRAFADAEELNSWQEGHHVRHPVPSLLASALLAGQDEAEALVTVPVTRSALRHNSATGHPFHWMAVTIPGGTADLLAPVEAFDRTPAPGAVIHGSCWVSGRVIEGLLPGPSSRKARGFGLRRPPGRSR